MALVGVLLGLGALRPATAHAVPVGDPDVMGKLGMQITREYINPSGVLTYEVTYSDGRKVALSQSNLNNVVARAREALQHTGHTGQAGATSQGRALGTRLGQMAGSTTTKVRQGVHTLGRKAALRGPMSWLGPVGMAATAGWAGFEVGTAIHKAFFGHDVPPAPNDLTGLKLQPVTKGTSLANLSGYNVIAPADGHYVDYFDNPGASSPGYYWELNSGSCPTSSNRPYIPGVEYIEALDSSGAGVIHPCPNGSTSGTTRRYIQFQTLTPILGEPATGGTKSAERAPLAAPTDQAVEKEIVKALKDPSPAASPDRVFIEWVASQPESELGPDAAPDPTAKPAPSTGTGSGSEPRPQVDGSWAPPAVPAIDFEPIKAAGTAACDSFPLGLPCYVHASLAAFSATSEAPVFTMPLPLDQELSADLAVVEPTLGYVRPILLLAACLGLAIWLAGLAGIGSGQTSKGPADD